MKRFTLEQLEKMPTLHQGHTDNLKWESNDKKQVRVWLSRMTKEDGMPYDNQVIVEQYNQKSGRWEVIDEYEAV